MTAIANVFADAGLSQIAADDLEASIHLNPRATAPSDQGVIRPEIVARASRVRSQRAALRT
jgi:hypothetical protein